MTNAAITPHVPTYVSLYYVDYRDSLNESAELLEESLRANCLDPINEKVDEWWSGYDLASDYIKEIRDKLEEEDVELSDDDEDEIREWLWDNDTSTPVKDLLGNTGSIAMFYSLGLEIEGYSEPAFLCPSVRYSSVAQEAYKIRRKLGIQKGTKEADLITSIVENASYGGELRIYFSIPLEDALSENMDEDFKTIHFKGNCTVAVYHSNGSGDFEHFEIDKVFPFDRDNLFTSESDKYPLEDCFGMCGDWLDNSNDPIFSHESTKGKIKKSDNAARIAQEAEYKRVFKAGGCTRGDMDYTRHRDVYYKNEIPCGSHCPHCGTFWVD